ncbi:MAG TPA: hypothetical protein VFU22_13950, partial [Roseiflexaceae bacterium]|nr:hypothetical protein [Roseiflexaceae bacterium]
FGCFLMCLLRRPASPGGATESDIRGRLRRPRTPTKERLFSQIWYNTFLGIVLGKQPAGHGL